MFPLVEPDSHTRAALEKEWHRQDLVRYLSRWARSGIPREVPAAFYAYDWRACDLGCGFGKYLLRESGNHPDRGYLGIDKGTLRGGALKERVERAGFANLFALHSNAIPILAEMPGASLDQLTIFYPNPWWPAKHRKKRWSYHPLFPKLFSLLKPGGQLLLASNEAFYLSEFQYAVEKHPALAELRAEGLRLDYAGPVREAEGRSHFESKFMAEGTAIGELVYKAGAQKATQTIPGTGNSGT